MIDGELEKDGGRTCSECGGRGYVFYVPAGFNPFYAGAMATAKVALRKPCRCKAINIKAFVKEQP